MKKRDGFNSHMGTLMAMIGSAVGLGNLWKFPYMAGANGGAAFILIYILFLVILCFPLMLAEFIIGRRSHYNAVGAFRILAPSTKWYLTGILGTLTAAILSFYSVVGGWTLEYLFDSVFLGIKNISAETDRFASFTQSAFRPVLMHFIFLGLTVSILWTGVKNGIEKYSKFLTPLLFIMVLGLAIFSMTLPNASVGIEFMLKPKWEDVTPSVVLNALGQGLFSLSLGMGIVITYSSYVNKKENLGKIAGITIGMDLKKAALLFPSGYDYSEILKDVYTYEKRKYNSSDEAVIPRQFFWDEDFDYQAAGNAELINEFLSTLDYKNNEFLNPPKTMLKNGFLGTPYKYESK